MESTAFFLLLAVVLHWVGLSNIQLGLSLEREEAVAEEGACEVASTASPGLGVGQLEAAREKKLPSPLRPLPTNKPLFGNNFSCVRSKVGRRLPWWSSG